MKILYEILIPTVFGDTLKPISTSHHKKWDNYVQKITGGLTILSPAKGKWIYKGTMYPERVIPVREMCDKSEIMFHDIESTGMYYKHDITNIIHFTLKHYRQKAV